MADAGGDTTMAKDEYRADMSNAKWDQVFTRQALRRAEVAEWLDRLAPGQGETLLDIGSGPGFVSLMAAARVGATGMVIAVDRSADALRYLAERQSEQGVENICRIAADAATLTLPDTTVQAALLTVVLHHTPDPPALVAAAHRCLAPGGRLLVAEYHPDAPGQVGPPLTARIRPELLRAWLEGVGFTILEHWLQTSELYAFLAQRP